MPGWATRTDGTRSNGPSRAAEDSQAHQNGATRQKFTVTGPDGKPFVIEGPDGATQEEADAMAVKIFERKNRAKERR